MNLTKPYLVVFLFSILMHVRAQERSTIPVVQKLLDKMTLDEKIGQLNLLTPGGGVATGSVVSKDVEKKITAGQVGGLFGVAGPDKVRVAQELAVKHTRLKIPLLFGSDVIHGYKTTFPIPLGISCSWDPELIEKTARVAAVEATADGINWNFSPMVDIARDPRWGRIAEGAGEDPYLGSAIAEAMVQGYQGTNLSHSNTMLSCVKHFALYGASQAGRDYHTVDMSKIKMFNQYLPPYKAAVDAGVASVMSSFNDVDGIPATGNKWLLTDLLRDRWGFIGFVVSDYTSLNEMIPHGFGNLQDVSAISLKAGLDMDMVGEGFLKTLKKSVEEGRVTENEVTEACRRILEAKYRLGLFDDPYRYLDSERPKKDILTPEHRQFAREVAARSFVLLKNHNGILPIKKNAKVALVGPLADSRKNMLGTWAPTGNPDLAVTVIEGFKKVVPNATISYAKGSNITDDKELAKKVNVFGQRVVIDKRSPEAMIEEAVDAANTSDVVVAVVGEATEMSGEAASRTDISIPESQKKLIRALVATGKPIALVLMSGRPLTIPEEFDMPVAILQVWHSGVEAGNAIADVVFGDYNPSGKLTTTWPRNVGQIPIYHSVKNTGRPNPKGGYEKFKSNYLDVPNTPLLPFGYGLSYTSFEYSNLRLDKSEINQGQGVNVSVTIENTGDYDGEEVVQLYLSDVVRSITPPRRQLKGFKKVMLKKGERKEVTLSLTENDLKFYNSNLEYIAEPGEFVVYVGPNSNAELSRSFVLK
ncbi:beta-glucosidase BglX [Flagellimonas allohymeniacidonis]|uniref:Periplasmic beta-glucosidase n=1 Tax=Flagellimonas allohymeniacidonis TaxID=2517819 RepID=A0A4Q8QGL9_9FLAO|nr:beta-glucosidase BglX [Allomuricauda hymeniacidonis]TAI48378.1 beta-glucosidase BglX [Allomuricauda hymeniacidonis]